MKKFCVVAALAATVVSIGLLGGRAASQQPMRMQPTGGVALVDVKYIFDHHPRFKAMMEELKDDFNRAQGKWRVEGEKIKKQKEELPNYRPGTPDYKRIEEEIVRREMEVRTLVQLEQKDLVQKESKIHYNILQEIRQELQYICRTNNIGVVIQFNGDQANPDQPNQVLRDMNQQVLWYNKDLDITPLVMRRFLDTGPAGPVGVRPNTPSGSGPR